MGIKLTEKTTKSWYRRHTELSCHIIQADVVVEGRVRDIWVAGEEFMTEQTQTLLLPADLLGLFSIFSVLQEDNREERIRNAFFCRRELIRKCVSCLNARFLCTCVESTPSCPSLSRHSSFSRFLMSGLAALMSILRLDVGVQGSTEPTSLPFLGVVRGPMVSWLSPDTAHWPNNFIGVWTGNWGATKPSSWSAKRRKQKIMIKIQSTSIPTEVYWDLSQKTSEQVKAEKYLDSFVLSDLWMRFLGFEIHALY